MQEKAHLPGVITPWRKLDHEGRVMTGGGHTGSLSPRVGIPSLQNMMGKSPGGLMR